MEFFVLGVTARSAVSLFGIQSNSAILFYQKIRQVINWHLARESEETFDGSIELDESYFGGVRKGKRGRVAADKVVVFGILKRKGKVYTVVVKDAKTATLMPIIVNKSSLTALFTLIPGEYIMHLMSINFVTKESITQCVSPTK